MSDVIQYFGLEQNRQALHTVLSALANIEREQVDNGNLLTFDKKRNSYLKSFIDSMVSNPSLWDDKCNLNISAIGEKFLELVKSISPTSDKPTLDKLFAMCYRFFYELFLTTLGDFISPPAPEIFMFITNSIDEFDEVAKEQIKFTYQGMPVFILKNLLTSDGISNIIDFNRTIKHAEELKNNWDKELEEKSSRADKLKESLDRYTTAFNFVGLFEGFDTLSQNKRTEKNILLSCLILFGILSISPVIAELIFIYYNYENIAKYQTMLMYSALPVISIIVLLTYYFRIFLVNYKSVKSHLLQIELRKTLCRFIQDYADYSIKIKEKDKDALGKFESVIFSGIVSNDEKLPSTFDGVDQFTKFINSIKKA